MIGSILRALNGFSYKEKSALISLIALAAVYGPYFLDVARGHGAESLSDLLATMAALVGMLVAVHVIFHIVITLDNQPDDRPEADERDRAIYRRASGIGYAVLSAAVLIVLGRILVLGAWSESAGAVLRPSAPEIVNLLLAALVLSEAVCYASQLVLYRLGTSR